MPSEFPARFDELAPASVAAVQQRIGTTESTDPNSLTYQITELQRAPSGTSGQAPTDRACLSKPVTVPSGEVNRLLVTYVQADIASGEVIGDAFAVVDNEGLQMTVEGDYILSISTNWPSNDLGTFRTLQVDDTGSNAFPDYLSVPPFTNAESASGPLLHVTHAYHILVPSTLEIWLAHDAGEDQTVQVLLNAIRVT